MLSICNHNYLVCKQKTAFNQDNANNTTLHTLNTVNNANPGLKWGRQHAAPMGVFLDLIRLCVEGDIPGFPGKTIFSCGFALIEI